MLKAGSETAIFVCSRLGYYALLTDQGTDEIISLSFFSLSFSHFVFAVIVNFSLSTFLSVCISERKYIVNNSDGDINANYYIILVTHFFVL